MHIRGPDRTCVIDAVFNVSFLLLEEMKTKLYKGTFNLWMLRASLLVRLYTEGKPKVKNLHKLNQFGPILYKISRDLFLRKDKVMPGNRHLQQPRHRFSWLFERNMYSWNMLYWLIVAFSLVSYSTKKILFRFVSTRYHCSNARVEMYPSWK